MEFDPVDDDWQSLERVFRAFPSQRQERAEWRSIASTVYARLLERGHLGLPALIPGLVHARLATALVAAGYRRKAEIRGRSFLCLGCHAGLEVRILRDFGAGRVLGIERRAEVVEEGVRATLIDSGEILVADFWDALRQPVRSHWDEILVLAPEALDMEALWLLARPHLVAGGHLTVVAQASDIEVWPSGMRQGVALEGTMGWYSMTAKPERGDSLRDGKEV